MFQSLLVPLDGSKFSERTLPLAHGLAKATGACLHLAHVHVTHAPDHFLSNTQFQYEGLDLEEYESQYREQEKNYLSQVELPVTFGLGEADRVDALRITWPGGQVQPVVVERVDTTLAITQATAG